MSLDTNLDKVQFSTTLSYQKIAVQGSSTVSVPFNTDTSVVIPHNLGYVPTAKVWYEPRLDLGGSTTSSGQVWPLTGYQYGDLNFSPYLLDTFGYAYLDSTNLTIVLIDVGFGSAQVPVYWRIYYDA